MKTIIILCSILSLIACCATKKAGSLDSETAENFSKINGVVHVSTEGCMVYIDAREDKKSIKMYPVSLADEFKVEGMKISFTYILSRAVQPKNCTVDKVVSLENVTKR